MVVTSKVSRYDDALNAYARVAATERAVGFDSFRVLFDFFFFQAEDGIRDKLVTGVQTCALPILIPLRPRASSAASVAERLGSCDSPVTVAQKTLAARIASKSSSSAEMSRSGALGRSEERRVGEEWRSRGAADHLKKKKKNKIEKR